jgi:hypothetical protein
MMVWASSRLIIFDVGIPNTRRMSCRWIIVMTRLLCLFSIKRICRLRRAANGPAREDPLEHDPENHEPNEKSECVHATSAFSSSGASMCARTLRRMTNMPSVGR